MVRLKNMKLRILLVIFCLLAGASLLLAGANDCFASVECLNETTLPRDAASQRTQLSASFAGQSEHTLQTRWDAGGRLQSLNSVQNAQGSAQFNHDAAGRLSQIKRANGASIRYGYDALGRRISRTREAGGQKQETQWILDTARPYSEIVLERSRQNGGAWQETRYTHTSDGVGQLISEQRQGKMLHVYEDVPRQREADIYDLKGWQHTAWHPKESAIPEKFRLPRMELNWLVMRRISFCVNAKWRVC